jgi:hypothetical protein
MRRNEGNTGVPATKNPTDTVGRRLSENSLFNEAAHLGRGGKLSRSEVVTIRLDPKMRYLAELAARKQRRTLSSFIEWTIERSLKEVDLTENFTIADKAHALWDVDECDRFVKLALHDESLLNYREQVLWKHLQTVKLVDQRMVKWDRLRDEWPHLKSVAESKVALQRKLNHKY